MRILILATIVVLSLQSLVFAKKLIKSSISNPESEIGTACEGWNEEKADQLKADRLKSGQQLGSWVSTNDYPRKALNKGQEGTVKYKLLIAPTGFVKMCWILKSSGYQDLDEGACKTLKKRARFSVANDINGKAIEGCYINEAVYKIAI